MEELSRTERVRIIVKKVLSDSQPHTYGELKERIMEEEPALLERENLLSTVLYRLMKANSRYVRVDRMTYQYVSGDEKEKPVRLEGVDIMASKRKMEMIGGIAGEIEEANKMLSAELSGDELLKRRAYFQKARQLRKEVESFLQSQ